MLLPLSSMPPDLFVPAGYKPDESYSDKRQISGNSYIQVPPSPPLSPRLLPPSVHSKKKTCPVAPGLQLRHKSVPGYPLIGTDLSVRFYL